VLIVEVAETSYRIDREYKASLYARAAVPDYWIIDLNQEAIEVHREPEVAADAPCGWRYRNVVTLRPPATVALLAALDSRLAVADLLP
jgi:Uma2 family endonuclease